MDKLQITILPDGSVKVETGAIGDANHALAESVLRWLAAELGGPSTRVSRGHVHVHVHEHEHEHEGHGHEH